MTRIKYTKELLQEAAKNSKCITEVCRYLGKFPRGSRWYHIKKKLKEFEIDTSHFLGKAAHTGEFHTGSCRRLKPEEILVANKKDREKTCKLRRALLEIGREYRCDLCLLDGNWAGKILMLEIDHIDRDWSNCQKENLRFLCPNCHSQETHPFFKI
jgi:Zn finger protein HypA/HybF involved in hydrogenase expression